MKANELMIGDWVSCDGKNYQIAEIGGMVCIEAEKELFASFEDIEPIPLTPEILEKNGFVYNDIPFVQSWEQFGLALYLGGDGYRINCGQNVAMIIDSVHQLQHVLRLCGLEKEIVL